MIHFVKIFDKKALALLREIMSKIIESIMQAFKTGNNGIIFHLKLQRKNKTSTSPLKTSSNDKTMTS